MTRKRNNHPSALPTSSTLRAQQNGNDINVRCLKITAALPQKCVKKLHTSSAHQKFNDFF